MAMSTPTTDPALVDPGADRIAEYAARGYAAEVLPIRPKDRTWKTPQFITVWMGPIHNILSYFTVMTFFALGLNAWQVVGAIMTAAVIVSIGYILNGQAAAKYGVPFAMQLREATVSTYMGNELAIPHGTNETKDTILESGLSLVRYDGGVDWGGEPVSFVVGIAGKGDEHLEILGRIAILFSDEDDLARLKAAATPQELFELVATVNEA